MEEKKMIERVAKAINELGRVDATNYRDRLAIARAAIEAMREPTDAMERAGLREVTIDATWFKPAWQAAIDAAL